jgi:dTDP-4-amino-4,6-dideoxygalactose transaminase
MVAFEQEFAKYVGGEVEAVALNSATAGLHLALEACGIGPGDEVIVPTWTFTATAEVVRYVGAKPVLVDVESDTLNLDLRRVADELTAHTRAVIPVHFAGLGADMRALREVVGPDVRIIEDAAHALPTVTGGVMVGECRHTDAAVFSFYATKTITTGEGGMLTTRDPEIAGRARIMRLHGIDRDAFDRYRSKVPAWFYDVVAAGYKYNLTDPAAAMGRAQLARSDEMQLRRQDLARSYLRACEEWPVIAPPDAASGDTHAWHLFVLRIPPTRRVNRDSFINALAEEGIGTSVHFIPLHRHSVWRKELAVDESCFPNAEDQFRQAVSLPLFSAMTDDQLARSISSARRVLSS